MYQLPQISRLKSIVKCFSLTRISIDPQTYPRINEFDLLFLSVNLGSNLEKGGGGKNPSRYSIIGSPTKGEKVDRKSIHESAEACFTTGRGPRAITRTSGRLIALLETHQRRRTTHAELKRPIDRLESRFRWSRVRVCGSLYCTTAAAP